MKRTIMAVLAALAIAGAASAQGSANPPPKGQDQLPQQTTISGKLEWIEGTIGLKSGGSTYFAPQLRMLVGFVKDLQEGASVTLTGYAMKVPYGSGSYFFHAVKLSFNGKDYELGQGGMMGRGFGGGRGQGCFGPGSRMRGAWDKDGNDERPRGQRW
jgi:hypothetical protein